MKISQRRLVKCDYYREETTWICRRPNQSHWLAIPMKKKLTALLFHFLKASVRLTLWPTDWPMNLSFYRNSSLSLKVSSEIWIQCSRNQKSNSKTRTKSTEGRLKWNKNSKFLLMIYEKLIRKHWWSTFKLFLRCLLMHRYQYFEVFLIHRYLNPCICSVRGTFYTQIVYLI